MRIKVLVIDETVENYTSEKRGLVASKRLVCLDADPHSGEIMKNTFDYELSAEEEQFHGSLRMKTIEIGITEFTPGFGGRLRARGKLVMESVKGAVLPESVTPKKAA